MAMIKIDGVEMPTPTTYSVPMSDMNSSDSAYSESGVRFRNRIRQGIVKLELAWRVGGSDASKLLSAIEPSKVGVEYYDPRTSTYQTADMMVEDRSCKLVTLGNEQAPDKNLWDISFSLVQY